MPHFRIEQSTLPHGLPRFSLGSGEPLIVLRGFAANHANPKGMERPLELKIVKPLAERFRVHAVTRAPGMRQGTTMAEIATQHAEALMEEFGEPVNVLGLSSGGSLALQLAADHPHTVRKLVVAGAGHRLTDLTRRVQRRYTEVAATGRRSLHLLAPLMTGSRLGQLALTPALWLMDPMMRPSDPADPLAFARAEDSFSIRDRLSEITAPTLVINGDRDLAYTPEIFRETAEGIPDCRHIVYPGASHMGSFTHPRFASDIADFVLS
ncbi:alpha/beta fold hydrolase [Nonomuraea dietziae]|uniref:alpha/beta fold hydrolase n=1 Tax=Nonomuraea dietziae TaxID=65515 RepID=UPI0034209F11